MSRVSGLGAVAAPARRARVAGGFAVSGGAAEAASGLVATTGVAALLAVQEDGGGGRHAAEHAAERAEATLAELTGLQLDLLRGGADPARLARLVALAETPEALADPGLQAVAQAVALRARVELARRARGGTVAAPYRP